MLQDKGVFYYRFCFWTLKLNILSFFKTIQDIWCASKAADHNFILSYLYLDVF